MTYTQIEQNIVYVRLHSLLLHSFIIKVLDHEKFFNTHFAEINSLIKRIKVIISVEQDI